MNNFMNNTTSRALLNTTILNRSYTEYKGVLYETEHCKEIRREDKMIEEGGWLRLYDKEIA
jgi:hypothetical protein